MKRRFSHKKYDEIMRELDAEGVWDDEDVFEEDFQPEVMIEELEYDVISEEAEEPEEDFEEFAAAPTVSEEEEDEELLGGVISFKTVQLALAVICFCLLVVFGISVRKGMQEDENRVADNYTQIGSGIADVDVLGGDGLLALQDALQAAAGAADSTESSEYQETDNKATVDVALVLTSIQKDLKIKFTNKKTGKLIANIPFQVEVKDSNGKTSIWVDEDMDGIVYKENITSGEYRVSLIPLEDEKYEKYSMVASNRKVTVKETIEYAKVDVSAEIKSESEINTKKEEQQIQKPIESELVDTVGWVESTKTYIGDNYKEIGKSDIDVTTVSVAALTGDTIFRKNYLTAEIVTPEPAVETEAPTEAPTEEPAAAPTEMPTEEPTAAPTAGPTLPPTAAPTLTPTPAPSATPTPSLSPTPLPSPTVTPVVTTLKTKTGLDVYVKDGDNYKLATTLDYNKENTQFFVKEQGYKYTGWNTIDGYTYYFDANGKAVTGQQVIRGAIFNFDSNGRLNNSSGVLGIDVSKYNGSIDWKAVKNAGVDYVIIRCGYRGYGSGVLVEDSKYRTNINGAINAGLKVGVYFFSQAISESEAVEEASMVLELVSGYKITFPIFLDVEYSNSNKDGRADRLSVADRTAVCKAFCQTIQNAGYRAGIYANKTWLTSYIDTNQLSNYKIWLAQYAKEPTYTGRYDMWQYSSTGTIDGISGDVDLNMSYLGY